MLDKDQADTARHGTGGTADTASPISAGPGIAKASADAAVTPKPVGTAPPINPTMMARGVALERTL